jgi:hypothetical protein
MSSQFIIAARRASSAIFIGRGAPMALVAQRLEHPAVIIGGFGLAAPAMALEPVLECISSAACRQMPEPHPCPKRVKRY